MGREGGGGADRKARQLRPAGRARRPTGEHEYPRCTFVLARWRMVMGLADNIRAKVHQGVLPPGLPEKIAVRFGDGRACSACDEPLLKAHLWGTDSVSGCGRKPTPGCMAPSP